jgi:hypothetical protein
MIDLHLNRVDVLGLTFGGFEGSWKYKPRGNYLYEQDEVEEALKEFPAVDVFVAHNSPRGIRDKDDETHYGFDAFNAYISLRRPKIFIRRSATLNRERHAAAAEPSYALHHLSQRSAGRRQSVHLSDEISRPQTRPISRRVNFDLCDDRKARRSICGHHRAYARHAQVALLSLDEYEKAQ